MRFTEPLGGTEGSRGARPASGNLPFGGPVLQDAMPSLRPTNPASRRIVYGLAAAAALTLGACSDTIEGAFGSPAFDFTCNIANAAIFDGGPGRDGIPALNVPELARNQDALFMDDTDRVLGVEINGEARAYPLFILWRHEIVNDTLGGVPILVTYCPLTGSGIVFDAVVDDEVKSFGVSGLLYENNLIMFDRQTESLWNQMLLGANCGPERGTELLRVPVVESTWGHWRRTHERTTVMTTNTGYEINYGAYPYGDYDDLLNDVVFFPWSTWSRARPPKELVLGVYEGDDAKAYPFGEMEQFGVAVAVNDTVGGRPILVTYHEDLLTARAFDRRVDGQTLTFTVSNPDSRTFTFTDEETSSSWDANGVAWGGPLAGKRLEALEDSYTVFWFAWSIYYRQTRLLEK